MEIVLLLSSDLWAVIGLSSSMIKSCSLGTLGTLGKAAVEHHADWLVMTDDGEC